MDKRKRGILYWLRVVFLIMCIGFMCVRCVNGFGFTAYATDSVTLSVEQTLALFGTECQALIYPEWDAQRQAITFDYAFPLSSVGYMNEGGGFSYERCIDALYMDNQLGELEIADFFSNTNGLVYVASSSQWGGVDIEPYDNTSLPAQIHLPFSISLTDIGGIKEGVFISSDRYRYDSMTVPYDRQILTWLFSDAPYPFPACHGMTVFGTECPAAFPLPAYPYYSNASNSVPDSTNVQYFTGWYIDTEEQPDSFDCRGFTIDAYAVMNYSEQSADLWLIVLCPTLYAYDPPAITTTIPAETMPPNETMPPAYTDTPQQILNQNIINNNYKLDVIIGQLNLIYAKLAASGELGLNVNLPWDPDIQEGLVPSFYGTDLQNQMNDIIANQTTYTMPELNGNNRFVRSAFAFLWDIPFVAVIGTFSLAVSIASWIIFRGRGGG